MHWKIIIVFISIIFFEVLATYFITEWSDNKERYFLANAILCYVLVAILFGFLLLMITSKRLVIANGLWQILNLIIVSMIGIYLFNNRLLWYQWVGVGLAVVATFLIVYGEYVQSNGKNE